MAQSKKVLEYMERHGGITSKAAFTDLGIISLSRRICDLREQGHSIKVERVAGNNRYGEKVYFSHYSLEHKNAPRDAATSTEGKTKGRGLAHHDCTTGAGHKSNGGYAK